MNYSRGYLNGYPASNKMTANHMYQHMSSHYRRILNAKPVIDTSTPHSLKIRQQAKIRRNNFAASSDSISTSSNANIGLYTSEKDRRLMAHIVDNEQFSASSICGIKWNSRETQKSNATNRGRNCRLCATNRHVDERTQFCPRILKSDAQSKLREMRVYHPPRRRQTCSNTEWETKHENLCNDTRICDETSDLPHSKEPCQASSRDSAYNGGYSSTADSRSPTPRQSQRFGDPANLKEQHSSIAHVSTQTNNTPTKDISSQSCRKNKNLVTYTAFIHDITTEVVEKGQFSDNALSRIFNRHIAANAFSLDEDWMREEINKLRARLGAATEVRSQQHETSNPDQTTPHLSALEDDSDSNIESWTTFYRNINSAAQENDVSNKTFVVESASSEVSLEKDFDACESRVSSEATNAKQGTEIDEISFGLSISAEDSVSVSDF